MENEPNVFSVKSVSWKGHLKRIRLEPGGKLFDLPLSSCVSEGDKITSNSSGSWVICKNGLAQILNPYIARETLHLGAIRLEVVVKEITEADEFKAYSSLSEFHYRSHVVHGRTSRLVIRTFDPVYPKVVGFIELATPFYMNKARSTILDAPLNIDSIEWQRWDMPTLRKYIHLIARIARVVVYPEFRGFGTGQMLVKHAAEFAKTRWQVSGLKPYFLEISADMIKYIPFAERAGMIYVGDTQGNLQRVAKDMNYLISRFGTNHEGQADFEKTCGICDQQVSRMTTALQIMEQEKLTREDLIKRLGSLSKEKVLKDFALFHKVVTLPKPHYMLGLHPVAQEFLIKRVAETSMHNGKTPPAVSVQPIADSIRLNRLGVTYVSHVRRTQKTHAVQQAFGISPDDLRTAVIRNLSVELPPGTITLVVGPSGSGKTTLLDALLGSFTKRHDAQIDGQVIMPRNSKIGSFASTRSEKALVEVLGTKDVELSLYLLGLAGLSEAFLYLKRFSELSAGQKYRAMLARLLASDRNVWVADEFCANLDPITANLVGHNVQRIARKVDATVILGASHSDHFVQSLKPDIVIQLTSAWEHAIMPGNEYCRMMVSHARNGHIPSVKIPSSFMGAIREGRGTAAICAGKREFACELLLVESGAESIWVRIASVEHKEISQITDRDAQKVGALSVDELTMTLNERSSGSQSRALFTIVHFDSLLGGTPGGNKAGI
ncbi:ABC transporter/Acetyltransferase (GNAT) family [Dehalogenimonas alkenigignens]|uniref:ABC transporter/Acetyltransferase (GNAT) family n=1 Tax=Dehalogenimonas alkenigignens TaxID=1217799 RepID=A0A0W0GGY3_9CHLR|nr:GNAT family N-acetyltransferase [Dehalogenimonas alkenigignens]KTB47804.1 ABC transporter/Acetyltransferase (GNAT) family [Dehalogenimonas alkenigignens]